MDSWIIQDFNGDWTRDPPSPVRRSNQLSYEATYVGEWSFVGSNEPVRNEWTNDEMIHQMYHTLKLFRALHRYHEVIGSNAVEVLNFSGFHTQLQKLRSQLRAS